MIQKGSLTAIMTLCRKSVSALEFLMKVSDCCLPLRALHSLYLKILQILGGSFISTGQLASKFARYQFRPHFFQHATFRVVCQVGKACAKCRWIKQQHEPSMAVKF